MWSYKELGEIIQLTMVNHKPVQKGFLQMCFICIRKRADCGVYQNHGSQWSISLTPSLTYLCFNGRFLCKAKKDLIEILYRNQWSILLKSSLLMNLLVNPISSNGLYITPCELKYKISRLGMHHKLFFYLCIIIKYVFRES